MRTLFTTNCVDVLDAQAEKATDPALARLLHRAADGMTANLRNLKSVSTPDALENQLVGGAVKDDFVRLLGSCSSFS